MKKSTKGGKKKEFKHIWLPFGSGGVTTISEYTPSLELTYIYHWYCKKCRETTTTRDYHPY